MGLQATATRNMERGRRMSKKDLERELIKANSQIKQLQEQNKSLEYSLVNECLDAMGEDKDEDYL